MDIDQYHHEVDLYSCEVQPIERTTTTPPNKNHSNLNSSCTQLSINLVYQVQHRYVSISNMASADNFTLIYQYQDDNREETLLCEFDNPIVAYNSLSSKLSSFEIDSNEHREIVNKIIDCGKKRIRNSISNNGPTVFSLRANITRTHNMYRCERCMEEHWAMVDSMVDEGMRNNGMVPAKKSSVKKMLKSVRVVGEEEYSRKRKRTRSRCVRESETCTVCLEEFGCGTDGNGKETSRASCMPCEHVFHEDCIISWLNQSHYCPICRFEMPC